MKIPDSERDQFLRELFENEHAGGAPTRNKSHGSCAEIASNASGGEPHSSPSLRSPGSSRCHCARRAKSRWPEIRQCRLRL